ncbi:hypothetical protein H5410_038970 [Solanum commersonii]|uniref:Uncharacterized protein n=1 Tax=Solanum commersonii TaxID=4109 RepID=A0A9J5YC47_SOLCO|nr:hypothetical protein H5410_038970 [Solanum commersonii]
MLHPSHESNRLVIQEFDTEDDDEDAPLEPDKENGDMNSSKKKRARAYANRNPLVEHPEDLTDGNSSFYFLDVGKKPRIVLPTDVRGNENGLGRWEGLAEVGLKVGPTLVFKRNWMQDHSKSKIISKDVTRGMKDMKLEGAQSKPQSMSYRRVTYGGIDGTYYTATTTRRAGNDGVCSLPLVSWLDILVPTGSDSSEVSTVVSSVIQDLESVTMNFCPNRDLILTDTKEFLIDIFLSFWKLASDGKVDTMQTLHNLEEDELAGFEQTWNVNANNEIPGWNSGFDFHANAGTSSNWLTNWEAGFRDPFSGVRPSNNSAQSATQSGRPKKVVRINIE